MRAAAVVLGGGRSSRMGSDKAALPWHGSTLLRHVCGLVGRDVDDDRSAVSRPLPAIAVECLGVPSPDRVRGVRTVRSATVGAAARAAGVTWDRHVLAAVDGDQLGRDGDLPFVTGDTVAVLSAAGCG